VRFSLVGALARAAEDREALTGEQHKRLLNRLEGVLLSDTDPGVRSRAATALGECAPPALLGSLWKCVLAGEDVRVQEKAWAAFVDVLDRAASLELLHEWEKNLLSAKRPVRRLQLLAEIVAEFGNQVLASEQDARLALVEQGFVYASANLRGGGEYGDAWHKAGMRLKKQNVFNDCIAAAEWLIANHYTRPEKLALHGISNGGLLAGAVINQRPDLFRAAVAQAGVMDMLRFQKFTIGWNWIADYGSSDNPEDFKNLYAYSPIHNVREGQKYPAVLITTADHDDRVVPGHSFKYAATMQAKASPENPVLIRIDTNSGHGPSSTTKELEQIADIYSFLMYNLGVTPRY